jgi:hypothetical protein
MAKYYDIDTSVRINGGLTVNGDTSIPSSYNLYVGGNITGNSNLYIANTITGNTINGATANITNINSTGTISGNYLKGDGSNISNLSTSAMPSAFLIDGSRQMTGVFSLNNQMMKIRSSGDGNHYIQYFMNSFDGTKTVDGPRIAGYQGIELVNTGASKTMAVFQGGNTTINTALTVSGNTTINGTLTATSTISTSGTLSGGTIVGNGSSLTVNSTTSNGGTNPISNGWAYTHENKIGSLGHIPSGGSSTTFLRGDNSWATPTDSYVTGISSTSGGNGILTVSRNNGLGNLTLDLTHNHDSFYYTKSYIDSNKINYGDAILNTNPFGGGKRLYINSINNALFRATDRWMVTGGFYSISDGSYVGAISQGNLQCLFDGNYETYLQIPSGSYADIHIAFNGGYFPNYPYGTIYMSHYYTNFSQSGNVSVYCNYAPQGIGWHTYQFTDYVRNGSGNLILQAYNGAYNISEMWFQIYSPTGNSAWITQIEFNLDRPSSTDMPLVDKYKANTLYSQLSFADGNKNTNLILGVDGTIRSNSITSTGNVSATSFTENGTLLSSKYLGINSKASDSDKLDGLDSSNFLRTDIGGSVTGNLFINNHGFGGNPSIALAVGDTDTGLHSTSDGTLYIYANNVSQATINNGTINFTATNLQQNGYKIWHSGNMGSGSGLNADLLDGIDSTGFTKSPNGYVSGNGVISLDTRNNNYLPTDRNAGLYVDFKTNATDSLSDGGTYHGVLTFRTYGSGADLSGGNPHQLGFTENGNIWYRRGNDASTWQSWHKIWHDGNMGVNSGLNADMIDGIQGIQIVSDTGVSITNQDLNTITGNGIYRVSNWSGNNIPSGAYAYGTLEVIQTNNSVTQNYYSHSNGQSTGIWTRTKWNASDWTVWKKVWTDNNMGSGSGLDADKLDGRDSSYFVYVGQNHLFNSMNSGNPYEALDFNTLNTVGEYRFINLTASGTVNKPASASGMGYYFGMGGGDVANRGFQLLGTSTKQLYFREMSNLTWAKLWSDQNMGAGSGLDADTVDGIQASQFVRNDQTTLMSSHIAFDDSSERRISGNITNSGLFFNSNGLGIYDWKNSRFVMSYSQSSNILNFGTGILQSNGNTIWHAGNDGTGSGLDADTVDGLQASQFTRNDLANQTVNTGFTMSGNAYVGMSNGAGALVIRTTSGANGIQLAGDNATQLAGTGVYMNASGNANFSGTITANAISVSSTGLVTNLNSQMINGVKEPQLAKNISIYETSGMGVYTGLNVVAQVVPNMTVLVSGGTAYTNTGMRVTYSNTSVSLATASSTYDRKDVVYIQGSSAGANEGVITVATGTPAPIPAEPSIPSDAIKLAVILVQKNIGSIQNSVITDARVWKPLYNTNGDTYIGNNLYIQGNIASTNGFVSFSEPIKNSGTNTSLTFTAGTTSMTWTHNQNLTNYIVRLSCNSPEPHVYWSNKTANAVTINFDDVCETDVIVDVSIEAY